MHTAGYHLGMPRKRRKGHVVDSTGTVLKPVRLELPENVHYWLRVEAAKHEMSMGAYARHLVEQAMKSPKRRPREEKDS
jgi:hypothetical protein